MLLSRTIVAVSTSSIHRAETRIGACEGCDRTADRPFGVILGTLGIAPAGADFLMCEPARCPACGGAVFEHTLVEMI
jgi:hypothetical protein